MPRTSNGASNMLTATLQSAIGKEANYKKTIKDNHNLSVLAASRLKDIEDQLMGMATNENSKDIISEEDIKKFMEEQRQRLLQVAHQNVQNDRTVNHFVAAAKQLRQDEHQASQQQQPESQQGDEEDFKASNKDYGAILQDLMEKDRSNKEPTLPAMEKEPYVCQIQAEMGVDNPAQEEMGEDEDIVFMNNTVGGSQAPNLKCPITAALLEDPVRSRDCKHVYSREGITQLIAQRRNTMGRPCECPVPGCGNRNVTLESLEDDAITARLVKREKRRLDQAALVRASQASMVDSGDEEDY